MADTTVIKDKGPEAGKTGGPPPDGTKERPFPGQPATSRYVPEGGRQPLKRFGGVGETLAAPRPVHWVDTVQAPRTPLYWPDDYQTDILDALSQHCGIQWALKRPMAEDIVNVFYQRVWETAQLSGAPKTYTEAQAAAAEKELVEKDKEREGLVLGPNVPVTREGPGFVAAHGELHGEVVDEPLGGVGQAYVAPSMYPPRVGQAGPLVPPLTPAEENAKKVEEATK